MILLKRVYCENFMKLYLFIIGKIKLYLQSRMKIFIVKTQ